MRHRVKGRKLGRTPAHRRAMLRNMTAALLTHGQITTTLPKAKALQPFVEHLIHVAKRGTLHARRQVIQAIGDPIAVRHDDDEDVERNRYGELVRGPRVVKKLVDEIAPQYQDREGGYTRIVKLARYRIGDGADLCVIQLVGGESEQGPQVAGQHSRRREQANKRMAYAAQLRKGKNIEQDQAAAADAATATSADESASGAADATASATAEPAPDEQAETTSETEPSESPEPPEEGDAPSGDEPTQRGS